MNSTAKALAGAALEGVQQRLSPSGMESRPNEWTGVGLEWMRSLLGRRGWTLPCVDVKVRLWSCKKFWLSMVSLLIYSNEPLISHILFTILVFSVHVQVSISSSLEHSWITIVHDTFYTNPSITEWPIVRDIDSSAVVTQPWWWLHTTPCSTWLEGEDVV
jgi:hypothetical protein